MNEPKHRLLIVDDDRTVLSLLTHVLRDQYAVTACPAGLEALRRLKTEPFDLVITDLRLPDVTGLDILNAALILPDAPAVIIITGYATMDSAIQATNNGASAYLPKPLNLEYLRSTVGRALERRQLEQDLAETAHSYRRLYQQAQEQVRELQLLFEASQLLGQPFEAQGLGPRLVHILEQLLRREDQQASVLLFEDETDSLAYAELSAALTGMAQEQWFHVGSRCPADCPVRAGRPRHSAHVPAPGDCPTLQPETRSALCVPVHAGEHVIGALRCESHRAGAFTEPDERLLATFAGQVAAAIQGLRTAQQRERLAVLEERDRLARTLHDGLAQRFSYLGLTLDGLIPLLAAGRLDAAREDVARLRRIVDEGQEEIRAAIADLRQTADEYTLAAELAGLVRRWSREQQGIAARFRCATPRGLPGSPAQAEHLLGIVQEALNNVAKHARASQVEVAVEAQGAENVLTIADDGVGFDPALVPADEAHFGLSILTERAALLEGRLTIHSAPGRGTRLTVAWPASAGGEGGQP